MECAWATIFLRLADKLSSLTKLAEIRRGENVVAAEVAKGWYAGRLVWGGGKNFNYGNGLGLLAQLEITYSTGDMVVVESYDTWQSLASAIVSSEFYDGEGHDTWEEIAVWSTLNYESSF